MKKLKFSVLILAIGTLISKVLGLVREMYLAQKFGAGYISDAFILAISIPTILITSFAGAINTNYIPIISEIEKKKKDEIKHFNGILTSLIFIISSIIVIIFYIFTKQIVKIFALGYDDDGLKYVITISRVSILSIYFILMQYIFQGFLEYKGSFRGTALNGILLNLGFLAGLFFSSKENYCILGYGILFGYLLSFLYVFILALKKGFKSKISIDFKNEYLIKLVKLTLPLLLNSAIWEINGLIDKSIASKIGKGYITSLNYANYIVTVVVSVFVSSIGTVIFPKFVKLINEEKKGEFKEQIRIILKTIVLITIPCTILLSVYSTDIIKVLFYRGEFSEKYLKITSNAMVLYSLAITFSAIELIMYKAFYSFQDTKTPTKTACLSIILNITLNLILSYYIGYVGIVLSTVISVVVSVILLLYNLNKKVHNLFNKDLIVTVLEIIFINVVLIIILYLLYSLIPNFNIINETISIIIRDCIIAFIGLGIYGGIAYFMKNKLKES